MSGPVTSAPKFSDYVSNDGLAKALIESFPEKEWALKPRSLGTKIGQLDKGNFTWWAKNPEKAECLAQLLNIPLEDLGIHNKAGKDVFHFPEFPEFPPLDLKRERSWQLAEEQLDPKQTLPNSMSKDTLEHWLGSAVLGSWRPPHEMDWLCIPDDLYRQLVSRRLSAAGRHEVVFVETLLDAERRLANPKPVIISVSRDGGEGDLAALACRPQDAGILVIASFMFSAREETSSAEFLGWEARTIRGIEGRKFDLTATSSFRGEVKRWTLNKLPDWRKRLLIWVEERLNREYPDTHFSAQGIGAWLDRFDPLAEWFCTTADVMQLCRLGHLGSEKKLPEASNPLAGEHLAKVMFSREKPAQMLRIRHLANSRWHRNDLPWMGTLSLEAWAEFSSAGMASVSRFDIEQIATGKTKEARATAADQVASLLEAGNPDALLATGLLKEVLRGCFDFRHRTLARLLVRDHLIRLIVEESLETWAAKCFDHDRRPLVDAALDAVSMECLVRAAGRLSGEPTDSVQAIGASEALFMAISRRSAKGEVIPASLSAVAKNVIQRLDLSDDWSLAQPWSRPLELQDEQLEWVAACWAWSLLPECGLETRDNWLFPGWSKSLSDAPYWLSRLTPDEKCEVVSPAFKRFLRVADQWVNGLGEPIEDAPTILLLSFMCRAALGGFDVQPAWWKALIDQPWAAELLQDFLESAGKAAVRTMWKSFLAAEREDIAEIDSKNSYKFHYSRIRFWLLGHLEPGEIFDGLSDADLAYLGRLPELLPPKARAPLLEILAKNPPVISFATALPFIERFGYEAVPALVSFLEHPELSYAAAECMWRWDAEKSVSLLRGPRQISEEAWNRLLWACPVIYFPIALDVLTVEPEILPLEERASWARKYLPNSGKFAAALLDLTHSNER